MPLTTAEQLHRAVLGTFSPGTRTLLGNSLRNPKQFALKGARRATLERPDGLLSVIVGVTVVGFDEALVSP